MNRRRSYRITLGCRSWRVRFERLPTKDGYRTDGYCHAKSRTIALDDRLEDADLRRVFIHEALHALFWFLDEDVVDQASTELAHAMDELDI